MPIEHRVGDLFSQQDVTVFAHQANIYHTFGSGIAKFIKEKYPFAFEADKKTVFGSEEKLGTYSTSVNPADGKIFINAYSQIGLGATDHKGLPNEITKFFKERIPNRQSSYDLIDAVFRKIESKIRAKNAGAVGAEMILGIPYQYGSERAGGDWIVVQSILSRIFDKSPVKLVIVRLPHVPEVV